MKNKIVMLVLVVGLSAGNSFATNGTKMVGFDARTMGRGGATMGLFDTPVSLMTNPAGICFMNSSALELNLSLMVPSVSFQNSLNDATGKTNYFPLPDLGYVNKSEESPFAWGIGIFTQGGMGADFTLDNNLYRDQNGAFVPQEYHSKFSVMQGGPTVAYKILPNLSVGVTADLVYSQLEFWMPYSMSPSVMQGVANPSTGMTFGQMFSAPMSAGGFGYNEVTASARMTGLTAFGFQGKVGVAYKLNGDISFGLSYTSPSTLNFKNGKATMDMTYQFNNAFALAMQGYIVQNPGSTQAQAQQAIAQEFTQLGIDLSKGVAASYGLQNEMKLPQSIALGTSVKVTPNLLLALDVEWTDWHDAFSRMSLTLSSGNNSNINTMLGNNGNFGIIFPLNWKSSTAVRFGGEYAIEPGLTVRAGYAYGSNPVDAGTIFPVFPAITENDATIGATVGLTSSLSLDLAYEHAFNNKETASAASLIASEYDNSTSQLAENIFHIGLNWNF